MTVYAKFPQQKVADFLRHIHFGSEVYYVGQLCDAWNMDLPGGDAVSFHVICHGDAWLQISSLTQPVHLSAGDIALFPHDTPHAITSRQDPVQNRQGNYGQRVAFDRNSPGTGLICGHLGMPRHVRHLLLASFPEFMLIRPDKSAVGERMRTLIDLMIAEAEGNDLGMTAIMDRLSDMLFLYVIRHTLHLNPHLSPLLIAMTDEHLRQATLAFIEKPDEPWTVDTLAKLAYLSRSSFSERFTGLVGIPPMEFVAAWRMQLAWGWLAKGNASMLDIALRCGYDSEAAFRKAFKRIIGVAPGQVRRLGHLIPS